MKWKCVLGTNSQRSEVTEGQISGSAVMKCIMLPPPHHLSVPCQPCVQLWSRIVLQRTHQRVWLIWAVLPRRMGLLSKNTPSQFGTTLISHINIHLRAPKLRGHTGGGGSVSCLSFTNNMTWSLALLVYTTLKMHSTLVWSSILSPINCNIIRIWP